MYMSILPWTEKCSTPILSTIHLNGLVSRIAIQAPRKVLFTFPSWVGDVKIDIFEFLVRISDCVFVESAAAIQNATLNKLRHNICGHSDICKILDEVYTSLPIMTQSLVLAHHDAVVDLGR